jgi:hypothetical protein
LDDDDADPSDEVDPWSEGLGFSRNIVETGVLVLGPSVMLLAAAWAMVFL